MKIAICASMAFAKEMLAVKEYLEEQGHKVELPRNTEKFVIDNKLVKQASEWGTVEGANLKMQHDLIRLHYNKIKESDAILVINEEKKGVKNYIGGNSFLEMGFAYILKKKIFVLNSLPQELKIIYQELVAMKPIVLNGNLLKIK